MEKIVLWIPNFSEGRNKEVIDKISAEALKFKGCSLLDVSSGFSTNRTIYTFAGTPAVLIEAAINACKAAYALIDMTKHKGEHPRLGALDVSPFVPLKGVTFDECVKISKTFSERLTAELKVPVYLYGKSSSLEYRNKVPQIRAGEYEGLTTKFMDPAWKPDYGPSELVPTWGASIVGCRDFLIAFNVNILSTKEQAHRIALNIRETGRGPQQPGRLQNVQAIGWMLTEENMAQVSTNIVDFKSTPIYRVTEEIEKDAKELSLPIVGSEIIGLIPIDALLACAQHYIQSENLMILDDDSKIKLAITRLGLNTIKPFDKNEQIIEYKMADHMVEKGYSDVRVKDFIAQVGSRTAFPGGGSVSALVGSLGCALSCMVGLLSHGNKKFEDKEENMKKIIPVLYDTHFKLLKFIDDDAKAFKKVLDVNRKNFQNPSEKINVRDEALQNATQIPLDLAIELDKLWIHIKALAGGYNVQTLSDLQVSVRLINAAIWGCYYNVMINVKDIKDESFRTQAENLIQDLCDTGDQSMDEILKKLEETKI